MNFNFLIYRIEDKILYFGTDKVCCIYLCSSVIKFITFAFLSSFVKKFRKNMDKFH